MRLGLAYLGTIAVAVLVSILSRRSKGRAVSPSRFRRLVVRFLPVLLLAYAAYPTTTDVYTYLHGALTWMYGTNPYLVPANRTVTEMSPYLSWQQTMAYGPVSLLLFSLPALFVGYGVAAAVYALKALCLGAHLLNARLLWEILSDAPNRHHLTATYLFCPIILYEHVAQAHADVFLILSCLGLILALRKDSYVLAALWLVLGSLTKTLPVIWFPVLFVYLIRRRPGARVLAMTSALVLASVIICTVVFLPTGQAWASLLNPGVDWHVAGSLHEIALTMLDWMRPVLPQAVTWARAYLMLKWASRLLFVGWYGSRLATLRRRGSGAQGVVLEMGWSTLILFLVATPWYQPWYASLLIPFALVVHADRASRTFVATAMVFAIASASYHVLAIPNFRPVCLLLVSILTVIPTLLVLAFAYHAAHLAAPATSVPTRSGYTPTGA